MKTSDLIGHTLFDPPAEPTDETARIRALLTVCQSKRAELEKAAAGIEAWKPNGIPEALYRHAVDYVVLAIDGIEAIEAELLERLIEPGNPGGCRG